MSNWEKTLENFRALGGVASNIVLRDGPYGRGIFPISSNKPVTIIVPSDLLVPQEWLLVDSIGNIIFSENCSWTYRAKQFYLDYLQDYGFTSIIRKNMLLEQDELFSLPDSVKSNLIGFGMDNYFFQKPDNQLCLDTYKRSRRILNKNGKHVLMPILELINHDEKSKYGFKIEPNFGISGKFRDEVLVNYGFQGDAVLMHQTYGFSTLKPYAFSGALAVNVGSRIIKIARYINLYNKIEKTNVPKISLQGNDINLSFLVIGSLNDRSSPKKIFLKLMQDIGMPAQIAEDVFDGIVNMNRQFFKNLLKELEPLDGNVIKGLRTMSHNQLLVLGTK